MQHPCIPNIQLPLSLIVVPTVAGNHFQNVNLLVMFLQLRKS